MKQKRAGTLPILADALRSLAVALAIVVLMHLVFWIAGHSITAADELDSAPTHVEDQADAP
jgi:hypothetical protein